MPPSWVVGARLTLRGPLGSGFRLSEGVRNLALAALGESASRLIPLLRPALEAGAEVALFTTGAPPGGLPSAIEVSPLSDLTEALAWPDELIVDLPLDALSGLRRALGLGPGDRLPCRGQVLVETPLPCGGLGDCGACAVPARRGWLYACREGPVFDLEVLDW